MSEDVLNGRPARSRTRGRAGATAPAAPGSASLFGRDDELAAIDSMLSRGGGSSLLVVGEAGLGKSALLDAAGRAAAGEGWTVLRATGVRSEARVPFAGLHQLLYPLSDQFAALAPRQREGLLTAFGQLDGPAGEVFLVALATLEVLADAGGPGLLVIVDDLHWIDDATAQVLGFVARRIETEPVALLAATRPGSGGLLADAGVPVQRLRPLPDEEAGRLVLARHPDLNDRRRAWVVEQAEGNPLALAELPLAAGTGQPGTGQPGTGQPSTGQPGTGQPSTPSGIRLTDRLKRSFTARVSGLSAVARSAVVVAAAADSGDFGEIAAAVALAVPGAGGDSLRPAVDAGLLTVSQAMVTFEHPLVRSAVYQSADVSLRRRAHTALAEVLSGQPERRAWHLAAAAPVPDEAVAAELEVAAESAARRGAGAASAAAWEQAADLTPEAGRRARRLLRAAELALQLGQTERAAHLAGQAAPLTGALADRARLALIREARDPGAPADPLRVRALADLAAELIGAGDADLAFRLIMAGAVRVWSADPGQRARDHLITVMERLPVTPDDPRLLSAGGFVDPARYGDLIARRIAALHPGQLDPASSELAMSIHLVGADAPITAVQRAVVDGARTEGKLALLPRLLTQQAWNAIALADWQAAVPAADEAARLAVETGQPLWHAAAMTGQAMIAGMRGDADAAERLTQHAEALMLPARVSAVLCGIQFARGVAAIAQGRYEEAFEQLRRVFERGDPSYQAVQSTWALGDLAEAAARTARTSEARQVLAAFRPGEADSVTPWARTALLYAAPLLADDDVAEREFRRALAVDLARWPSYRARLLLEYGSWLRRRRRPADARAPLRTARQICEAHDLAPWAERARLELRATGEASEKPQARQWTSLSPQELQIALLAAEGLSNREIAQRLYLSHRTVGSHLYRVFPKLGITSRVQLREVMAPAAPGRPGGAGDVRPG